MMTIPVNLLLSLRSYAQCSQQEEDGAYEANFSRFLPYNLTAKEVSAAPLEKVESQGNHIDRLQPKMDEDGPYFEMNFALPKSKIATVPREAGCLQHQGSPSDIQDILSKPIAQMNIADEST